MIVFGLVYALLYVNTITKYFLNANTLKSPRVLAHIVNFVAIQEILLIASNVSTMDYYHYRRLPDNTSFRFLVSPSTWKIYDQQDFEMKIPSDAISHDKMLPSFDKWVVSQGWSVQILPKLHREGGSKKNQKEIKGQQIRISINKADLLDDVASYDTMAESPPKGCGRSRRIQKKKRKSEGSSGCKNKKKRKWFVTN